MILILGGTTEGRNAAQTLEQAGTPYFYSTKTGEQELDLRHGACISGALDQAAMQQFCLEHKICLLVDAAHPFAAHLHATVAAVAAALQLPAIRYERLFPHRDQDVDWVDDIADIALKDGERLVLSTLGVKSISRLMPLQGPARRLLFRILPRESSIRLAQAQGASLDDLCFYSSGQDELQELQRLRPDVLLLKESGISGGFVEKVAAAKALGIRVIALRRPPMPDAFHVVNGPRGLRRMVERFLPDFFPLRSGLTTGTCATAAAVAALCRQQTGAMPAQVPVRLPDGETISVAVGYGHDFAFCIKDAGDDPDITNGAEIRAVVRESNRFEIHGGEGVGRFTLPGFDYPPGCPAINRGPRQMLRDNIPGDYSITISVPNGDMLARRTFNPRLGIEGGISIIGVSGIVMPYSDEAFIQSIRKCVEVARASGAERLVLGSGAKSENALRSRYPELPSQAFVQYGNFVGQTLQMAAEQKIKEVTLGVMLGKAVKLADGQLDTHSRRATFDRNFLRLLLTEAECDTTHADDITLVRELWQRLPPAQIEPFARTVVDHCYSHCQPLIPEANLTILLIDDDGRIVGS